MRLRLLTRTLLLLAPLVLLAGCVGCPGCPKSAKEAGLPAHVDFPDKPSLQ